MTMSKVIGQTFLLYYITNYWYTCRMYRLGGGGRQVPDWLTKEQTALIQKDKAKGNIASNYRTYYMLNFSMEVVDRYINR